MKFDDWSVLSDYYKYSINILVHFVLINLLQVMNQAVVNVRTVASLGRESYFLDKFTELVTSPYRYSKHINYFYKFIISCN